MSFAEEDLRLFEQFLISEARLMDENRYEEWFALWSKDALYWIPCNKDSVDPATEVSLIYETWDKLEDRVLRLRSRFAHSQTPRSRLMRSVTNVQLTGISETELIGTSVFVLGEIRNDVQTIWVGRNHHTLVRTASGLQLKTKKVLLLNNDATIGNLTFLV